MLGSRYKRQTEAQRSSVAVPTGGPGMDLGLRLQSSLWDGAMPPPISGNDPYLLGKGVNSTADMLVILLGSSSTR